MVAAPTPWYKYPYSHDYGGAEPYGNYAKPDINIQCPDGTPVTALLPGTITALNASDGHVPAWGAVVTMRLDKPVNAVATHIAYLHLEKLPSFLSIGLHVPKGETIGASGGQSAQGSEKAPVGIALYNGDVYGEGPSWNLYVGSAWLDPTGILKAAGNSGTAGGLTAQETLVSIAQHIRPDESVAELLNALDVALQVVNPFTAPSSNIQADISLFGLPIPVSLPAQVTDPFQYIGDVAEGLLQNFTAVFIRALFIIFGVVVIVVIFQATFISNLNRALEPVGGISGAAEKAALLA